MGHTAVVEVNTGGKGRERERERERQRQREGGRESICNQGHQ